MKQTRGDSKGLKQSPAYELSPEKVNGIEPHC